MSRHTVYFRRTSYPLFGVKQINNNKEKFVAKCEKQKHAFRCYLFSAGIHPTKYVTNFIASFKEFIAMKSYILIWICLLFYCVAQDATEGNVDLAELKTLGDKALAENKFDDAIKYYTSAIKIDPEDVTFNYKRAAAYLLKGKNFNALEDLNIVLQNKPSFIQVSVCTLRSYRIGSY